MSSILVAVMTVAAILAPLGPRVSAAPASDWRSLRSPNFVLVGNAGDGAMKRVALNLEQFRQGLVSIIPQARVDSDTPTTVYVFKDGNAFRPFKPKVDGKIREQVSGYFLMRPEGNYVALAADSSRSSEGHQVIYHEYIHFLTRSRSQGLPMWLNEGLAEFYSTFDIRDDGKTIRIGAPIPGHVMRLRDGALIPLATLLAVDRRSAYYKGGLKTLQFYAQSWLLTHFLMLGNEGKYRSQIGAYVTSVAKGTDVRTAFEKAFGIGLEAADKELWTYLNKALVPVTDYQIKGPLVAEHDLRIEPIGESEANMLRAELLLRMGRDSEAEEFVAKVIPSEVRPGRLDAMIGELHLRKWKLDEATRSLGDAVSKAPADANARLHLGDAYYRAARYTDAETAYAEASRLRPGLAEAHLGLGLSRVMTGKNADAAAAFDALRKLDPSSTDLYRRRAYVWLGHGRGALAAADALAYIREEGWSDQSSPYMAVAAHLALREAGRESEARTVLEDAARQVEADMWISRIVAYLRGEVSAEKLLGEATTTGKQTEAHAYIGLDLLARGERDTALGHLRWVRENGARSFVEYGLVASVLRRIDATS